MKVYRGWWIVFVGLVAGMIHTGATMYVFSIVAGPMEEELGWSRSLLYGAISVAAIVTAVVSGLIGPYFDRYGARAMMTWSALVSGLALTAVALVRAPWQYYGLVGAVIGAARAFHGLGPRVAIANWFIRKRPSAHATYTVGGPMSGLVFVTPVAWVLTFANWRVVWVFLGLLEFAVVMPLSWLVIRRRPEEVGLHPDGETSPSPRFAASPVPEDTWTRAAALHTPTFWLIAFGFACTQFAGTGLTIHIAPYGLDKGLGPAGAAAVLTSYSIGCVLARVIWASALLRLGVRRCMIAYAATYVVTIAGVILAGDAVTTYLSAFVVGIVSGATMLLQGTVWPEYYGHGIVGALSGYSTLIQLPSQVFAPFGAALVHDLTGSYVPVFAGFAVLSLIATACFAIAQKPTNNVMLTSAEVPHAIPAVRHH